MSKGTRDGKITSDYTVILSPMSATTPFTVRVGKDLKNNVERLADLLGRPRSWVVNRALENFVATEEWQLKILQERVALADAGDFASQGEVDVFFSRWKQ